MKAVTYNSKDGTEVSCVAQRTPDGKFRSVIATTTRYGSHKDESGETFGSYEEAQKMAHAWALRRYPVWEESKI